MKSTLTYTYPTLTPYQQKYIAWKLDRHHSSSDDDKFTSVLTEAKVDLNPHQVEAALFAFKSPLSMGAILADEVGLGKTIEAALVMAQHWAEHRRHILVIVPATLRKQWSMELEEKFYIPSLILETKNFNRVWENTHNNPFESNQKIIICSYQFAKKQITHIGRVNWDLVVIDEAHKLRNVYKKNNKTSIVLKDGLKGYKKLLLTATPLQNNVKELYGLISVIDDGFFGNLKSFSDRYGRVDTHQNAIYKELKARIQPVIHRTLRSQVQEYVKYTERRAMVQEYYPSDDEQVLGEMVNEYMQREECFGIPKSQRTLITLVLHKLLSSSTFAIAGALKTIIDRLQSIIDKNRVDEISNINIIEEINNDVEDLDDYAEEWNVEDETDESEETDKVYTQSELEEIKREVEDLRIIHSLALGIAENTKGECLLQALKIAFEEKRRNGQPEKALIFTESNRTQQYLKQLLESKGYEGRIVLFNGSNSDKTSNEIYAAWKRQYAGTSRVTGSSAADKRQALVDYFRETAQVMIATEAASEGMNMQFCSLLVNFDLPWNPQRIEQRIGRCHRYGQKNDVVVVNFINKANRADQRVYELLDQKYNLFKGVFGSSDEVLGSTMEGIDFERRVLGIYQSCRSAKEIDAAFDSLQNELKAEIDEMMDNTRNRLIENFDTDVVNKLKIRKATEENAISQFSKLLWIFTIHMLQGYLGTFPKEGYSFRLKHLPIGVPKGIHSGIYRIGKEVDNAYTYRIGHPLAQYLISKAKSQDTSITKSVSFYYTDSKEKISIIENEVGNSGLLSVNVIHYQSPKEKEDMLLAVAIDQNGRIMPDDFVEKLLLLSGAISNDTISLSDLSLKNLMQEKRIECDISLKERDQNFINEESIKIERWAEDQTYSLETELRDIKRQIKERERTCRNEKDLAVQRDLQISIQGLQKSLRQKRQEIFTLEDEIIKKRDELIAAIDTSLSKEAKEEHLFTIQWKIV